MRLKLLLPVAMLTMTAIGSSNLTAEMPGAFVCPQDSAGQVGQAQPAKRTISIPFTLNDANNIVVQAVINQVDKVELMLHTAVNSVSVTTAAAERIKSVKFDKSEIVKSWGGEQSARYSEGNTLQIGELSFEDLLITEGELSGPGTDGKFGLNLFAGKIVEIDFDERIIKLHASLPKLDADYERLTFEVENGSLFIEGKLTVGDTTIHNKFLVHSGYGGTILLDDKLVSDNPQLRELAIISESELKDSYGNVLKTKKVKLPALDLGGTSFADLPIGFFEGSIGRQKMSVIGGDILKRFNLVIDAENNHIYLKPNKLFAVEFVQ
jgi:hypothetical protein